MSVRTFVRLYLPKLNLLFESMTCFQKISFHNMTIYLHILQINIWFQVATFQAINTTITRTWLFKWTSVSMKSTFTTALNLEITVIAITQVLWMYTFYYRGQNKLNDYRYNICVCLLWRSWNKIIYLGAVHVCKQLLRHHHFGLNYAYYA